MWSTIFTDSYNENLYRMGSIYFQKPPEEGLLPITLKGKAGLLPQKWKYVPDKKGKRELEWNGKTLKIKNTGRRELWAFVYWDERMPCQPGDEITFTFTASGRGPVYCTAIYLHWHGNWAGRDVRTLYLTAQPKQYTLTLKVPSGGKSFKRRPMEFRPMLGVREQMELSAITISLKRN